MIFPLSPEYGGSPCTPLFVQSQHSPHCPCYGFLLDDLKKEAFYKDNDFIHYYLPISPMIPLSFFLLLFNFAISL